ncbi:hypothetical protein [Archangium violaceum]|uniref:hypothetical protein n=1 Tax=Archangium violaceum TaxID=83451 RepID=UPI0036D80552
MSQSLLDSPNTAQDTARVLIQRVHEKHAELKAYAQGLERRTGRYNTISIVCSALATVLTIGGISLAPVFGSIVWKPLCLTAAICSAISAVCINIVRSSGSSESLEKAHRVDMKLEALELQLDLKQLPLAQGLELYSQVLEDLPGPDIPKLALPELISNSGAPPTEPPSSSPAH